MSDLDNQLKELEEIGKFNPNDTMYEMGKMAGRAEAITTVINLLRENPNIDGLEILKKL